jgi:capsular exopolysaccharide synthesis family protein
MSKFFEALERAEKERARRNHDRDGVASPTVASPTVASPTEEAVREEVAVRPTAKDFREDGAASRRSSDTVAVARSPSVPSTPVSVIDDTPLLRTQEMPGSTVAESFRVLQANLIRALLETRIRRVLVTSAGSGEGKSTIVANLGIALSQSEQRVLVIDTDVRRAQQHRLFDLTRSPGLIEYLLGEASVANVVRPTATRSLSLISAGHPVAAPAEPLSSRRMVELLEFTATQFDVVLLDAPAVLDVADTRMLAPLVDGVLVVVREGTVTREALRRVRQSLQQVHAKILGLVLNRIGDARTGNKE